MSTKASHYPRLTARINALRWHARLSSALIILILLAFFCALLSFIFPPSYYSVLALGYFTPALALAYYYKKTRFVLLSLSSSLTSTYDRASYQAISAPLKFTVPMALLLPCLASLLTLPVIANSLPSIASYIPTIIAYLHHAKWLFTAASFIFFCVSIHLISTFSPQSHSYYWGEHVQPNYLRRINPFFQRLFPLSSPNLLTAPLKIAVCISTAQKLLDYLDSVPSEHPVQSYPLEVALSFRDLDIFKECFSYQNKLSPDLQSSCLNILQHIARIPIQNTKFSDHHGATLRAIQAFLIDEYNFNLLSITNDKHTLADKDHALWPSLTKLLNTVPLSQDLQSKHLSSQMKLSRLFLIGNPLTQGKNGTTSQKKTLLYTGSNNTAQKSAFKRVYASVKGTLNRSSNPSTNNDAPLIYQGGHAAQDSTFKHAFYTILNLLNQMNSATLTALQHILAKRLCLLRSDVQKKFNASRSAGLAWPWLYQLDLDEQCRVLISRLFVHFGYYNTIFDNALSASLALNYPGRPLQMQLKNSGKIFGVRCGITLVGRALKTLQSLEAFLNGLNYRLSHTTPGFGAFQKSYLALRLMSQDLEKRIFSDTILMSMGSTLPRFLYLHSGSKGVRSDIIRENPLFWRLFSTQYRDKSVSDSALSSGCNRFLPSESDIAQQAYKQFSKEYNAKKQLSVSRFSSLPYSTLSHEHPIHFSQTLYMLEIWSQLRTPRLPFWYHCTHSKNIHSIFNSLTVKVSHNIFSGAFISTSIESMYGDFCFAFDQSTPWMSNIFNSTHGGKNTVWHGCGEDIQLNPHLVAIGYNPSNRDALLAPLRKLAIPIEYNIHGSPLYCQIENHRVFLLPSSELDTLRQHILKAFNKLYSNDPHKKNSKPKKKLNLGL